MRDDDKALHHRDLDAFMLGCKKIIFSNPCGTSCVAKERRMCDNTQLRRSHDADRFRVMDAWITACLPAQERKSKQQTPPL
jgi:hypothetical protein